MLLTTLLDHLSTAQAKGYGEKREAVKIKVGSHIREIASVTFFEGTYILGLAPLPAKERPETLTPTIKQVQDVSWVAPDGETAQFSHLYDAFTNDLLDYIRSTFYRFPRYTAWDNADFPGEKVVASLVEMQVIPEEHGVSMLGHVESWGRRHGWHRKGELPQHAKKDTKKGKKELPDVPVNSAVQTLADIGKDYPETESAE